MQKQNNFATWQMNTLIISANARDLRNKGLPLWNILKHIKEYLTTLSFQQNVPNVITLSSTWSNQEKSLKWTPKLKKNAKCPSRACGTSKPLKISVKFLFIIIQSKNCTWVRTFFGFFCYYPFLWHFFQKYLSQGKNSNDYAHGKSKIFEKIASSSHENPTL